MASAICLIEPPRIQKPPFWRPALARSIALTMGLFFFTNSLGGLLINPHFDLSIWLIDWYLPNFIALPLNLTIAIVLLCRVFGLPNQLKQTRHAETAIYSLCMLMAAVNSIVVLTLYRRQIIDSPLPLPFSCLVLLAFALLLYCRLPRQRHSRLHGLQAPLVLFASLLLVCGGALLQMSLYGQTDYRRQADVAVVFGAKVYADGHCSLAVADRVRCAVQLYQEGQVDTLLFSGGPGAGQIHEVEGMAELAKTLGVPEEAIALDYDGLDTQATVSGVADSPTLRHKRLLMVSHFYHLPRIKLTCQRQGLEAYTVPAKQTRTMIALPKYMAREVVALGWYYLSS